MCACIETLCCALKLVTTLNKSQVIAFFFFLIFLNSFHSTHTNRSWNSFREWAAKWKAPIQRLREARGSNKCNGHWNLLLPCNCWSTSSVSELRSCVKVKLDILGSPSLMVLTVFVDTLQYLEKQKIFFVLGFASPWITLHFVKLLCNSVTDVQKKGERKKKFKKHASEATEHPDLGFSLLKFNISNQFSR